MRTDHHAYQRATRVAGFGLLMQGAIGILLLIFGIVSEDSAFQFASLLALVGVFVWLGLVIIFHQHKLERLEALEEDELAATRVDAQSIFDRAADETHVAARRLALMHKWLMPGVSLFIALALAVLSWRMLVYMRLVRVNPEQFGTTRELGWAIAICLAIAAVAFIFSRFVAGMAKAPAWQNLRGGAGAMVGTALVMVAVAVGIIFRFFENESVIVAVAWAIPVFMIVITAEILLNFVLNLYRPRVPGEVPRPAFDSKLLSLFAAPDNIVRSLNEAVNYQFGFDVTSSWGYQLLLRSFVSLLALGVLALVLLSSIVIVEPHQQAIRLRGGAIVDNRVHGSGVMLKWPWPIETSQVYDVMRVRTVHLTPEVQAEFDDVQLWDKDEPPKTDAKLEPFLVGSPPEQAAVKVEPAADGELAESGAPAAPTQEDVAAERVSEAYALVDAEIVMQYRIKPDQDGLLKFLQFGSESIARRQNLTDRERVVKLIALKEVSHHLARQSLDEVLSPGTVQLPQALRARVQAALDQAGMGVEVIAVDLPMLRPSGAAAPVFEEYSISAQVREQVISKANRDVSSTYAVLVGDTSLVDQVLQAIDRYNQLREEERREADDPDVVAQRQLVENLLMQGGGQSAQIIAQAETDRWVNLMSKRSQASRVRSQLASFQAAPELYRQRELMRLYKQYLPFKDKFFVAVEPARVSIDMDLQKVNPILDFAGASESEVSK